MINKQILKNEEKAIFALRSLYKSHGYLPFKMSKFEEYDLYVRNKDFLIGNGIITFNDTNGKLLALKPDVTLSIIKNGSDETGCKQKLYYNENVYRISGSTHQYKELMQTGIECIGDVDLYDIFEVTSLAAKSLAMISEDYVLEISHLGVLTAILDKLGLHESLRESIVRFISEKNAHDLALLCEKENIDGEYAEKLHTLTSLYGDMGSVINKLRELDIKEAAAAIDELEALSSLLAPTGLCEKIRIDLSIVNNIKYYNGFVFKGFLSGICEGVLAGGQYDKLMRRMGRRSGAVGFAIYLDLLEGLEGASEKYDVDVLLLYGKDTDLSLLAEKTAAYIADGKSVTAQKAIPEKLRYRELVDVRNGGN